MAVNNRDSSIRITLGYEAPGGANGDGGYTNNPKDPGGPTKWGITLATARLFWKPDATAADVRDMPLGVAIGIYTYQFWAPPHCDDLPAGPDFATFDFGVNSGTSRGIKALQRAVGVAQDGMVGAKTIAAAKTADAVATVKAICASRSGFLHALKTWSVFGKGWSRRVADVEARSVKMALDAKPLHKVIPDATKSALKTEAHAAKGQATAEVVKAGGTVATPAATQSQFDLTTLPHWLLVALGLGMAVALVVFVWRWNVHRQRAAAYSAVAKES